LACLCGCVEIVRALLDHGANMLATAVSGKGMPGTSMIKAVCRLCALLPDVLVLLHLQRGEMEGETVSGYTTLHFSAGGGSSDCISLLLQRGCPVDVRGVRGCSRVLAWAIEVPLALAEGRVSL
jgi:ankyrin repeat protein